MMAKALDANGAAKVYIIGRRLEKLEGTVKAAVSLQDSNPNNLLMCFRSMVQLSPYKATPHPKTVSKISPTA